MDFWSNDPKADKIQSVLGQVEEVKAVMVAVCFSTLETFFQLLIAHLSSLYFYFVEFGFCDGAWREIGDSP